MLGRWMTCIRSCGAPTCAQPLRINSTAKAVVLAVRGCGATMMALRPFSAASAFTGGVASGPVVGISAAITPTGLAILTMPRSGNSSTMPTVLRPSMSRIVPITRLRIFMTLDS